MRTLLFSLVLALIVLPALAQDGAMRPDPLTPQGENMQTPPTWHIRLDKPNDDVAIGADSTADIFFVNMTPGWHVTTGPAAIFYHPASTAEGTYRAETMIHLFDPGRRNEAFGLFVGGANLEEDDLTYDYFLIRNTGEFLIKRRTGSETSLIQDWTKHDAIQTYGPDAESSVPNTLAVVVGAENVDFHINGEQVASHPRSHVHTDGIVGLRVNHALNLHVEGFKVEEM